MSNNKFFQAISVLIGYTIGAGILGIPYVISKAGFWPGLVLLVVIGVAMIVINLMIAEIMLRTRYRHQLAGLIEKYLGKRLKLVQSASMIIGAYGAITAYLIGEGQILAALLGLPESKQIYLTFIFLIGGAIILFIGLKLIKVVSLWLVLGLLGVVFLLVFYCLPQITLSHLNYIDWQKIFLPYGVLLFAFGGMGSIFTIKEILSNERHKIRAAIIFGGLIVMLVYALFALAVIGVTGKNTTPIATIGLGQILGEKLLIFGNVFAFLSIATSFFTVSLSVHQIFHFDYKIPVWLAWFLVLAVPVFIFLFISRDFINVISFFGSLTFGVSGSLIVWTFWRAKKYGDQAPDFSLPRFKIFGWFLIAMFMLGFIYTIME